MKSLASLYGDKKQRKGFVLSLDALVASLILSIAIFSLFYHSQGDSSYINKVYLLKDGEDSIALIEKSGKIDNLDSQEIISELASISPTSDFWINTTSINKDLSGKSSSAFGGNPKNLAVSGKRFFVISNSTDISKFGVIRYTVWKK